MQAKFATAPKTGMTMCLKPLNSWCSRKTKIATILVSPYSAKVPKFETSVTSARPLGSAESDALELIPTAYHKLCGNVAIVLSSGAAEPAKKYSAAYAPRTAEIVASVQIAR